MNTFTEQEIIELRERYSKLYSGVIYDTLHENIKPFMPYVLSKRIRPSWEFDDVLCGPAFTVQGSILTDQSNACEVFAEMYAHIYDGCVEVISAGVERKISVFGEITGKVVSRFGACGTVVDGCARDIKGLKDDNFKVFSEGVSMLDALDRWQIIDYQKPVPFDGEDGTVWINPGDYIFGDGDGVLVIPYKEAFKVLNIAEKRREKEERIRMMIKTGATIREILDKEGRW